MGPGNAGTEAWRGSAVAGEAGLGSLRRRGWRSGSWDITGWLYGALFTVFQTRGNANTPRTRAQRGAWHCWSPALEVSGNGCKSNKNLTSTLLPPPRIHRWAWRMTAV